MFRRRSERTTRARRATIAATTALALLPTGLVATPAPAATPCTTPPVFIPTDEIQTGMTGTGLTVIEGQTPVSFNVEVLGVLKDYIFLGTDIILVDITGPQSFLDVTGGALSGMSGSPVYLDGKLAGAVAWGFGEDRTITGVTAAEDMIELFSLPGGEPPAIPQEIALPESMRRAIARTNGDTLAETGSTLTALPVPLGISGVTGKGYHRLKKHFAENGVATAAFHAASTPLPTAPTLDPTPILPGEPFGSSLSYGDISVYAIGTATALCGDFVVAYGHPLWFDPPGATSYGMNEATILAINQGIFFAFKQGILGDPHGMITQDRFAGEVGLFGVLPTTVIPVTSEFSSPDTGLSRLGETDAVFDDPWFPADITFSHAYANIGAVWQEGGEGTLSMDWTITGTRQDGTTFTVANRSMGFSPYAPYEAYHVANAMYYLAFNRFEQIGFTSVDMNGTVTDEDLRAQIVGVRVSSSVQPTLKARDVVKAVSGDEVIVEVTLDLPEQDADVVETLIVQVPRHAGGTEGISIRGGRGRLRIGRNVDSLDELIAALSGGDHQNDLLVSAFGQTQTQVLDVVVRGGARFGIQIVDPH